MLAMPWGSQTERRWATRKERQSGLWWALPMELLWAHQSEWPWATRWGQRLEWPMV